MIIALVRERVDVFIVGVYGPFDLCCDEQGLNRCCDGRERDFGAVEHVIKSCRDGREDQSIISQISLDQC